MPVYLGAPNWKDFVPWGYDAVIDAGAFDSPHELAEFLKKVAADDVLYERYHAWREQALPERVSQREGGGWGEGRG